MMLSDPIQHYYDIGDTQTKNQSNSRRSMSAWIVLNGMQTKKELGRYSTELSRADKNKSKSMIEYWINPEANSLGNESLFCGLGSGFAIGRWWALAC